MKPHLKKGLISIFLAGAFLLSVFLLILMYRNHPIFTPSLQSLVFTALSALATMFLSFIAFWQLPLIEKTGRAAEITTRGQFLISLNEQWMQQDVLGARCYLHNLALTYKGPKMADHMNKAIQILSEDKSPESIIKFAQVISLLEFMETLGTLYKHGHISLLVIEQLFGGSIERYYYYLSRYIEHRRRMGSPAGVHFYSDRFLYQGFDDLICDLKESRERGQDDS